jgi:hypothetical protein
MHQDLPTKGLAMPVPRLFLGVLLGVALTAAAASAQPCYRPIPQAPDACGPGYYCRNPCGMIYGPGYCLRPCFPPFQGMIVGPPPKPAGPAGAMGAGSMVGGPCAPGCGPCSVPGLPPTPVFPTHPYARSPRDYFMYYDRSPTDLLGY